MEREGIVALVIFLGTLRTVVADIGATDVVITCESDLSIQVAAKGSADLTGWKVKLDEGAECAYEDTFPATLDCIDIESGTQYKVVLTESVGITEHGKMFSYGVTCTDDTGSTASVSYSASATSADSETSDERTAEMQVVTDANAYAFGETIEVDVSFVDDNYDGYYFMKHDETTLRINGLSAEVLTGECADNFEAILVEEGLDEPTLKLSFKAPIDTSADDVTTNAQAVEIVVTVEFCTTTCDDYSSCERKRRKRSTASNDTITKSARTSVMVFYSEDDKLVYESNMYERLSGKFSAADGKDGLCVNKTASVVILVLLFIVVILCVLAVIWMSMKVRRARKQEPKESIAYGYSNESFKK